MHTTPDIKPHDQYNQQLLDHVHPSDWVNPKPADVYNMVVIGAGVGGLVSASIGAALGARVALVERHLLGGDCLNWGCVPSKAIIRSSRVWADIQQAEQYGFSAPQNVEVDFAAVMERMRRLRSGISQNDSAARFTGLGVDVFLGEARFTAPDAIEVDGATLRFKKAVIATGARAHIPDIPGLEQAGYLTNETIFQLTERPGHLLVLGGGPIGCEMAQAFSRLGSQVTIVQNVSRILPRDDQEAAEIVQRQFIQENIDIRVDSSVTRVTTDGDQKQVEIKTKSGVETISVDAILVSTGRSPNVEGLGLETAGVDFDQRQGVHVNPYMQTANPKIYAVGDVCMAYKFTHAADAVARIVARNALFPGKSKADGLIIPWCTYTDPEIAHVGMTAMQAQEQQIEIDTYRCDFSEVDRAVLDGEEDGFVKIHVRKGTDKIVGATIAARHAGDMINEITIAMTHKIGLGKLSGVIHPYPTQAEAIRKTADAYNRTRLTPGKKKIISFLIKWLS
jgi:pyruvate/2-oxoglutarate dehydrogenase complex dihydrolipoamide dehydrogenase (E3) component